MCHIVSQHGHARILALLGATLLVSSCAMVGPDFQKPEADVAGAWSGVDEPGVITESIDYRDWWKNFNDPVLDTLIQTAYEQNLTLQVAGLRVYEARAILGVAAGTRYESSAVIDLHPGDLLLLATDGLFDATSASQGLFGVERALATICEHRETPASALTKVVQDRVYAFAGQRPHDDVTTVIVKCLRDLASDQRSSPGRTLTE